jgi:hypothetical protein
VALLDLVEELRVLHRGLRRLTGIELVEDGHQDDADHHPDCKVFE